MSSHVTGPRVIVALDFPDADSAWSTVERLDPGLCRVKVGKELFTRAGPALVRRLVDTGFDVFLDLKFHDIPNTVARACQAAADLGVWMMNVHTLGGPAMLEAARKALEAGGKERPLLIGVTILTSMDASQLAAVGLPGTPATAVARLAALADASGIDGVVCSALEAAQLRADRGGDFLLVTPGIRPAGSAQDDQSRIATPGNAVRDGAHYLVIGRPVTQAGDPAGVLLNINSEISSVLGTGTTLA